MPMDPNKIEQAIRVLEACIVGKPTMDDYDGFKKSFGVVLGEETVTEAIRRCQLKYGVVNEAGAVIAKEQTDHWFEDRISEGIKTPYYDRYLDFLKRDANISEAAINATKENNYRTLKYFADPESTESVAKKGLVVGDVQAGKTMNYIGLINLASDMGYRTIVLLTGTTESLRRQTQERIDQGLIGAMSVDVAQKKEDIRYIGVGEREQKSFALGFTTTESDLQKSATENMAYDYTDLDNNKPKIFVVKKNSSIIDMAATLLAKSANNDSLLLIDDECDYASVNTKKEESPSQINYGIRKLLNLFKRSTYVGYSATPYANIFVDPEAKYTSEGEVPDLFPSDFIVLLEPPSDYMGAKDLFLGFKKDEKKRLSGNHSPLIRLIGTKYIDENGHLQTDTNFFPTIHKKDEHYLCLAASLKRAIKIFLLSSAVYSLRGYSKNHRSMLVNISRFNNIQEDIRYEIEKYVSELKNQIAGYYRMSVEYFNRQQELSDLQYLWENDGTFSRGWKDVRQPANEEFSFEKIREQLNEEAQKLETTVININHKKDRYDYDDHQDGARVIVVGGFALSRGLTIKGLMTSYYNRNAGAFDTLIQMGRWFGYRPGYEDLINIYMTQSSVDNFCAAALSAEDLKDQFRQMAIQKKKPIDFGLMVREAPDTLENVPLITARNKSRATEEYIRRIELSGQVLDMSKIFKDVANNIANKKATETLIHKIKQAGIKQIESETIHSSNNKSWKKYWNNVPCAMVAEYLRKLRIPAENKNLSSNSLIEFVENGTKIPLWDVAIAEGDSDEKTPIEEIDGESYQPVRRGFKEPEDLRENIVRIGGHNNRLIEPGFFQITLTAEEREEIKNKKRSEGENGKTPGASDWLMKCKKPLLVIYPIALKNEIPVDDGKNGTKYVVSKINSEIIDQLSGQRVYGIALGFPGQKQTLAVNYRINMVKRRELEEKETDIDETEDETTA